MALAYTAYTPDISTGVNGCDVTSTSRTYNSGELVLALWSAADNDIAGAASISNTATAQSWTNIATTNTGSNCKIVGWWCVMSTTQAMTITAAGSGTNPGDGALYVIVQTGQHATTPVPAGKIQSGTGGNDVTTSITPTDVGSCLWMVVGEWNQANALTAAANNTKEFGTNQAGQQTTALYRPTTQPRTDTSAFTIGSASDGTAETEAWIAFEVQAAPAAGPTIVQHPVSTNVINGQTASFSVSATSSGGALTYQWQDNSGGSFANISGATSSSYTTAATTSTFQRRQYRCVVTDDNGSATSNAATLTLSWHDVYLRAVPEDADPDDVRLRDPTVFDAGGGFSQAPGIAVEADTARQLVMQKMLARETNTALALDRVKVRAVGLATESDTAVALGKVKARDVGFANETNTALALGRVKLLLVGLATESDTALALARVKARAVGLSSEADTALALERVKLRAAGVALENDTALALALAGGFDAPVGMAVEADTALALARIKLRSVGLALEADTAFALSLAPPPASAGRHRLLLGVGT